MACQIGFQSLVREVRKNLGELHLVLGKWEQAEQILEELLPSFDEHGTMDQKINIYRLLGEAAIGKDDLDWAAHWAKKIDQVTSHSTDNLVSLPNLSFGELLRFQGMLAIAQGAWDKARSDLEMSVAVFRKQQSRLNIGRSLFQLGIYWFKQGGSEKAVACLNEAGRIFTEIGAKLDARRVEKASKAFGDLQQ
jgi:tetratricopeptide (TPR) repeat protein